VALLVAQADADGGAPQHVRITIRVIAATNDPSVPPGIDPKLGPIEPHIASFGEQFRFRSLKLMQEQTFDLDWKAPAQLELPNGRTLQVIPRAIDADGRINVHLELLGEHPAHSRKLHTDYAIQRGGTILIGGLRLDPANERSGKLLIAVTQETEK